MISGARPTDDVGTVDWAGLRHAYGAATDVPGWLAAVAKGDASVEHAMWCALVHQGQACEATAPAMAFLVDQLDRQPDLRPVFSSWWADLVWVFASQDELQTPSGAVRELVVETREVLRMFLEDADVETRAVAVGVLAEMSLVSADVAREAWDWLRDRQDREREDRVAADLVIGLAMLADAADRVDPTLELIHELTTRPDLVRVAAAAHALLALDAADTWARSTLVAFLPEGINPGSAWFGAGRPSAILDTLAKTPEGLVAPDSWAVALEAVLVLSKLPFDHVRAYLDELLPDGAPPTATGLDPIAVAVLRAFAMRPDVFSERRGSGTLVHKTGSVFAAKGLPNSATDLARWLDASPHRD